MTAAICWLSSGWTAPGRPAATRPSPRRPRPRPFGSRLDRWPPAATPADPLLNLSLQNAAQASGGKITALKGGVPVVVDGQVIGAVGIGGGTGDQDAQIARAGAQAFLDQLAQAEQKAKAPTAVEKPE